MANKDKQDLGLEVGTKEQVVWQQVLKEAKHLLKQSQDNIIVQQGMIDLAESKIEQEKAKMAENPGKA